MLFRMSVSLLFSYWISDYRNSSMEELSIDVSWVLQSSIIIVFSVSSPFMFVSICLMYLSPPILGAYIYFFIEV